MDRPPTWPSSGGAGTLRSLTPPSEMIETAPAPSSATQEPECDRHDEYHECDRQDDAHLSLLPSFYRGVTPGSSF